MFSDYQDEALDKFELDVKKDISLLLQQAGMLYVIAAKITFMNQSGQLSNFDEIIGQRFKLLNCLKANKNIIRILYKPFRETAEILEYYAVFVVQSAFHLVEKKFIQQIENDLFTSLSKNQDVSVRTIVQNLNDVFRQSLFPSFQLKNFLLIDGMDENWAFIQKWFLGFLYQLERLGGQNRSKHSQYDYIREAMLSGVREVGLKSGNERIELKFTYLHANNPQDIQHLLFFCSGKRAKYIWDIAHLSEHAREYIQRISIIYQENFTAWGMQQYVSLAVEIETFIMTLKESAYDAFYPGSDTIRDKLTKHSENIESLILITRQLLQFSCILRNRDNLKRLQRKLEGKTVSRTLKYFFLIYKNQTRDEYLASMLDTFLGVEIKEKRIKEQLDSIVAEYRFTQPLFFKPESRRQQIKKSSEIIPPEMGTQQVDETTLKQSDLIEEAGFQEDTPLDVESTDVEQPEQSLMSIDQPVETASRPIKAEDEPYKLFHVQRHLSRVAKVQAMLKSAMKTDVVIVRCSFGCNSLFRLTYKDFSKIFSGMLQDNKKRKPISEITAYLGYWEGNERNSQDQITSYAANVVFIFKAQTLLEHPDLFSELERLWKFACRKIESDCDSGMRVNGYVKKLQIAHVLEELQHTQVVFETTQKQLSKKIVEHLASYIVYQDLLDDNIYQELPKWLIKKNGSSGKTKTSKRVYNKT